MAQSDEERAGAISLGLVGLGLGPRAVAFVAAARNSSKAQHGACIVYAFSEGTRVQIARKLNNHCSPL